MASGDEEALYGEELGVGALVADWLVEHVQYRGPVSTLYRARHARTGAPAALKVLLPQPSDVALRRFRREAATLQRLSHPNIVVVLGYGTLPDGRPFIAMEWLEGRDLAAELEVRGPLSPAEALEVLEQVGGALRAAHAAGVVHRDLKAQNVVRLSHEGEAPRVKLVDFGVAKGLTPDAPGASTLTLTGVSLGTPLSMAPEQIRGEPPDARTDLYAMGVLLFHLVTGQPPFRGATRHEVEDLHLNAPPPRPSEHAPVPAALDSVVLRSMGKRREDRYPDVDALLEALRRAVTGGATSERSVLAMALYAEARLHGALEASSLERLDALLEHVGGTARAAGLDVRLEGSGCLLAVAPLPHDAEAQRATRARILHAALELVEHVESGEAMRPVDLAITVHVAPLPAEEGGGADGLLHLPGWVAEPPGTGLVATAAALEGLETAIDAAPVSGARLGCWRVRRAR
ncbi:serine/threonine-protein kinase [Myxococcus sp. Y35]|uniref:serine/threonine-protein kinase n=1 Tax=Pseudomyxococcus flavus TaxID=3115648 RepID=UPI003CEC388C